MNMIAHACDAADQIIAKMVYLGLVDALDLYDDDTKEFSTRGREVLETIYNLFVEVEA